MLSASYAIEIVDGDIDEAIFLAVNDDGTLNAVKEKHSQPDEFFRFVNSDESNSFLSRNSEKYIKAPNGCQNFHLRQAGSDPNQFALVSACNDDERIELNDGKFDTFRLVNAPFVYYFMMVHDNKTSVNEVTLFQNAFFDFESDSKHPFDEREIKELQEPIEFRLMRDLQGKVRIKRKGFAKNFCVSERSTSSRISYSKLCFKIINNNK